MNKLALSDKAIFLIISKAIAAIGNLVLGVVLVRLLPKADYGTYLQVLLICSTVSLVVAFGIPQSIYYFLPQSKSDNNSRRNFLIQTLLLLFIIGVIAGLICFLSRDYIAKWMNNPSLLKLSLIFCAYLSLLLPEQCLEPMLISLDKAKLAAGLNVIFNSSFILFILTPLLFGLDLTALFLSVLIFYLFKNLFIIIYILRIPAPQVGIACNFNILKSQLHYSFPLGVSSIIGLLSDKVGQFMISFWFPPAVFAVFARGAFQLPLVNILPYTLADFLLPKYIELHNDDKQGELLRLWHESVRKTALIILPIFIFSFLIAEKLIIFLFTSEYSGSVIIFRIYLFLLPLRLTAFGSILKAAGDTKSIMEASFLFLISNIILNIIFYKIFGFTGPAIATVVAMNMNIAYYLIKIKKAFNLAIFAMLPWKEISKISMVSLIIGTVAYPFVFLNIPQAATIFLTFVVFITLYILTALKVKMFTASDIRLIKKWLTFGPLRLKA